MDKIIFLGYNGITILTIVDLNYFPNRKKGRKTPWMIVYY